MKQGVDLVLQHMVVAAAAAVDDLEHMASAHIFVRE